MNEQQTEPEKERLVIAVAPDLIPFILAVRAECGFERDPTAVNNCIRIAKRIYERAGRDGYLDALNGNS